MAKQKRLRYYDNDRPIFPMTKTEYVKCGSKWVAVKQETTTISRNQTKNVLSKQGLPFERSHRLENRDRYGHNEPYDTFSSISPDGTQKSTWQVDFKKGYDNYTRLARKSYYDKQRYKKRKNAAKNN